jgi:YD repeat-containing protein
MSSLPDSGIGTFSATYDADGDITGESYPNQMTAGRGYDSTGALTDLGYAKTTNCSSSGIWYADHVSPSVHDQWLAQTSTLSTQNYTYDSAGRLTQVQDTPAGRER